MPTDLLKQLEEDQKKLKAQMGWDSPQEPTATGVNAQALSSITDKDAQEATGLLNSFMKGRMMVTPPGETFNDYFEKNNPRPALTALQDGIRSMLAGRTGQKFVSVRDQSYEQYKDYITRQDKIRTMERLELNTKVQSAIQLLKIRDAASRASATLGVKEKEIESKLDLSKVMHVTKASLELRKLEIAGDKTEASIKLMEAKRQEIENTYSKNPFLQTAAQAIRAQGKDPYDPEVVSGDLLPLAKDYMEAVTREPKVAGIWGRSQKYTWTDGFGRSRIALIDPNSGQAVDITPGRIGDDLLEGQVDFNQTRLKELDLAETSVNGPDGINSFIRSFYTQSYEEMVNNTGFLMAFKGELPRALSDKTLNEQQKRIATGLSMLELARTRAITGAQMTDRERQYITKTVPSLAADPATIASVLTNQGAMVQAFALRERLGFTGKEDLDSLDLTAVAEAQRQRITRAFEKSRDGDTSELDAIRKRGPMSAEAMLAAAAIRAGRKDVLELLRRERGVQF